MKIGIIIVIQDSTNIDEYEYALESLKCYAEMHQYPLEIIKDHLWTKECPQKDFMFKRHCIVGKILNKYDWILFLDADIGVINPGKLIEDYIDNDFDLIFSNRIFNWEIITGYYLAKNTTWTKNFLAKFADYEKKLPNSFHGTDNGAIHAYVVETLYPEAHREYNYCHKIWEKTKSFGDLFIFEACIRIILGSSENMGAQNRIKLLPKGQSWSRDGWLTGNQFSTEVDFMLHGWQKKRLVPEANGANEIIRTRKKNMFASWEAPLELPFDHNKCEAGKERWKWRKRFIISNETLQEKLNDKILRVHEDFLRSLPKIPQFVFPKQ
uniref:Glycosyltransferase n=1 Tax=Acrobeloides nanus TaxID=290746 RepID=A0A914CPD7_9BILA